MNIVTLYRRRTVSLQIVSMEMVVVYTPGGLYVFSVQKQHRLSVVDTGTSEIATESSIARSSTNSFERDTFLSVQHSILRVVRNIIRRVAGQMT